MSKLESMKRRIPRRTTRPAGKARLPRVRVAVALVQEDALLLVRHQKRDRSYWLLPGGGLEFGESLQEAAHREVLEETGIQVQVEGFLLVAESLAPDRSRHVVHIVFRGQLQSGQIQLGDQHMEPHERRIVEVAWVPLNQVPDLIMHPPFAPQLLELLKEPKAAKTQFLKNLWID